MCGGDLHALAFEHGRQVGESSLRTVKAVTFLEPGGEDRQPHSPAWEVSLPNRTTRECGSVTGPEAKVAAARDPMYSAHLPFVPSSVLHGGHCVQAHQLSLNGRRRVGGHGLLQIFLDCGDQGGACRLDDVGLLVLTFCINSTRVLVIGLRRVV